MRRAIVTGARGFLGRALVKALADANVHVVGVGRSASTDVIGVSDWLRADVRDPQLRNGISRADVVFHLAARVHQDDLEAGDTAAHWDVNLEGTRNLLTAAAFHGVHKFIFFSSVKAMGEETFTQCDESSVPKPVTAYGQSKLAAEALVNERTTDGTIQGTCLRLPMVWGPGSAGNLTRMVRAIARGRFPPLPEFGNRRSLVHVRDVVQAALLIGRSEHSGARTYIVTDGQTYSTREIYLEICRALGRRAPAWSVPGSSLRLFASIGDSIGTLTSKRVFDSGTLGKLASSAWYDSSAISRDLGYAAAVTLPVGLPELVRSLNLIPSRTSALEVPDR